MQNMFDFSNGKHFDYECLEHQICALRDKYAFLDFGNIGESILGKSIHRISFGKGETGIIYIASHHGMEWITTALLLAFLNELCFGFVRGKNIFDISTRVLFETRRIDVIPMLNPDGVDISIHGVDDNNIMKNRLIRMNNGSDDFSNWQANARGVDINHNYNAGFQEYKIIERSNGILNGCPSKYSGEYPESEPETKAICSFVRATQPRLALTLHTQGEEIFYTSGERMASKSLPIVQTLSRLTGYKISIPTGTAVYGGFTDWFIDEFSSPSFTLECGRGTNPLPFSDLESIYESIKRALFTAPILI